MRPSEAISLGLIDAAMSPSQAVADFIAELGGGDPEPDPEQEDETTMADQENETQVNAAAERKAEQARIKGIMTSEEAKGREAQAEHLAYETDLSVEAAVAILATGPKAEAETPPEDEPEGEAEDEAQDETETEDEPEGEAEAGGSHFRRAMETTDNPNVGPNSKGGQEGMTKVDQILAAQDAATGRRRDKAA